MAQCREQPWHKLTREPPSLTKCGAKIETFQQASHYLSYLHAWFWGDTVCFGKRRSAEFKDHKSVSLCCRSAQGLFRFRTISCDFCGTDVCLTQARSYCAAFHPSVFSSLSLSVVTHMYLVRPNTDIHDSRICGGAVTQPRHTPPWSGVGSASVSQTLCCPRHVSVDCTVDATENIMKRYKFELWIESVHTYLYLAIRSYSAARLSSKQ